MMLARNRVLAVTLSLFILVLGSPAVRGLGLGDIMLHSGLNEPLEASIRLIQLEGLEAERINVKLASRSAFERSGIDYPAFLDDISFSIEVSDRDDGELRLTTERPVVEPYLELIIDITWPDGRMMREYTMLVDPPTYSAVTPEPPRTPQVNAAADAAGSEQAAATEAGTGVADTSVQGSSDAGLSDERAEERAGDEAPVAASASVAAGEYRVGRDETLWEIASATRPDDSVSVQQMMIAIQRDNPQAFIGDNINTLRANAVLRMPADAGRALPSPSEALAEVRRQNRSAGVMDSAPLAPAVSGPTSLDEAGDELRILSAEESDGSAEAAGGAQDSLDQRLVELERQQMRSEEELDRARLESRELTARLEELNVQIALLDDIITLEDQRIAELQAELAARAEPPTQATVAQAETEPGADGETAGEQTEVAVDEAEVADAADTESVGGAAEVADDAPTPTTSTAAPDETAPVWLRNPLLLGGLGVLLVALVVGLLVVRRRRAETLEEEDDFEADFLRPAEGAEDPQESTPSAAHAGKTDSAVIEDEWPPEEVVVAAVRSQPGGGPEAAHVTVTPSEAKAGEPAAGDDDFNALIAEADRLTASVETDATEPEQNALQADGAPGLPGSTGAPLESFSLATAADDSLSEHDNVQYRPSEPQAQVSATDGHSLEEAGGDTDFSLDDLLDDVDGQTSATPASDHGNPLDDDDLLDLGDLTFDENDLAAADDSDEIAEHEEDAISGQIDLAVAYEAMGDLEGARGILREVLAEGDEDEQAEARRLLEAWDDGGRAG